MTPPVPRAQLLEALGHVLREALVRGETVRVPGLGTFRVEHQPSRADESGDGVVMRPPRDAVIFVPES